MEKRSEKEQKGSKMAQNDHQSIIARPDLRLVFDILLLKLTVLFTERLDLIERLLFVDILLWVEAAESGRFLSFFLVGKVDRNGLD